MNWLQELKAELREDGYTKKEINAYFAPDEDEQIEINTQKAELETQGYSKDEIKLLLEPYYDKILWDRIKNLQNSFPTGC